MLYITFFEKSQKFFKKVFNFSNQNENKNEKFFKIQKKTKGDIIQK